MPQLGATIGRTALTIGLLAVLGVAGPGRAASPAKDAKTAARPALLTSEAWKHAPAGPVTAAEIDRLLDRELKKSKVTPAPLTTDEQFIRRVSLDLVGHLPPPAEVKAFVADRDKDKRAKLIDKLLDSEDYAKHWARYWRDVFAAKLTDRRGLILSVAYQNWMIEQLKANKSWAEITRALLTAEGEAPFNETKSGAAFFVASRISMNPTENANDLAAETARVFLGVQIRCAQCHDHPFDSWKQPQFHELAAYFARVRSRPMRNGMMIAGIMVSGTRSGEHEMALKNNPSHMEPVHPRFLDGKESGHGLSDMERRKALADAITSKDNYWFAAAYANRIWGAMMGQAFYQPVDDMGPERQAVFGNVLVRLAASFRATDHDMKALFRVILNTQAYQRQVRLGDSTAEHLHFAASYPAPLRPDALWQSLTTALGVSNGPQGMRPGPFAAIFGRVGGLAFEVQQLFDFDPSLKADEVESTIAQALMLMNNPVINQKVAARGDTPLAQILKDHPKDDDAALKALYQRTLARQPTAKELTKCRSYIRKVGDRAEAFEDIQWTLINSTEFQSKR
jgi:hypothetical protein